MVTPLTDPIAPPKPTLFQSKLILSLDTIDLPKAHAVARDFRSCTTTMKMGQALYLAHGPMGARSFHELGMREIIADVKICGRPWEIWNSVMAASSVLGVSALTVNAESGLTGIKAAVDASRHCVQTVRASKVPKILVQFLPSHLSDQEIYHELDRKSTRAEYLKRVVPQIVKTGAHGLIVDYYDLKLVRSLCDLPLIAAAKRGVGGYLHTPSKEQKRLPGVKQVIAAGAMHVLYDSTVFGHTDHEWTAEILTKELS